MDFLHQEMYLDRGDRVRLDCDTQCNFMLLDSSNFSSYRRGSRFTYYGGRVLRSPTVITAPSSGHWHVVIDLGGASASIRYNLSVLKSA